MNYVDVEYIENEIFIEKSLLYIEKYNSDLSISLLLEDSKSSSENITNVVDKSLDRLEDLHNSFINKFFNNKNRQFESFLLKIGKKISKEEFSISFDINPEKLYENQLDSIKLISDNYDKPENVNKFIDVNTVVPDLGKPTDLTIEECIDVFHKFEKLSILCEKTSKIMYTSIMTRIKNLGERQHISNIGLYEMIHIMNIIHINIKRFSPEAIYNNSKFKYAVKKLVNKDPNNIKLIPNKFRDNFDLK
jgi:hypothetical protein